MVTNAHVVWPFETVRVTFPDGSEHLDVPVIGWDLMADLAIGDGGRAILIHGESAAGDRTFALYAFAVDRILESLIVLSPRNEFVLGDVVPLAGLMARRIADVLDSSAAEPAATPTA